MRRLLTGVVLYAAALAAAAACSDGGPGQCFEPDGIAYQFYGGTDTSATFRWPGAFQPVRYYAEPVGALPMNVDSGLQLWMNATRCGELSLVRITDSTTADIIIRNPPQMPPPTPATGFALSPGRPQGAPLQADSVGACFGRTDIRIDAQDQLERPTRVYVVPQNIDTVAVNACYHFVVAHEIGHTLGLFAHSPDAADLMNSTPRRRVLSLNDRYTLQVLYHREHIGVVPQPR